MNRTLGAAVSVIKRTIAGIDFNRCSFARVATGLAATGLA
jgi:hypothetical protein